MINKPQFEKIEFENIKYYTFERKFYYPLALIPFKNFGKTMFNDYSDIIVDVGVGLLNEKNNFEYPFLDKWENKYHKYANEKCYFVIPDYPVDVLPPKYRKKYQQEFIEKTEKNILKWHHLPRTILSIQYEFENIIDFKKNWKKWYEYSNEWIAIGNLCKSQNISFFKDMLYFLKNQNKRNKKIHFFGLNFKFIKEIFKKRKSFDCILSFDSSKWVFNNDKDLMKKMKECIGIEGFRCRDPLVPEFFSAYHDKLKTLIRLYEKNHLITNYLK